MSEEIKENSDAHAHRRKSSIVKCVRDNPWIISSFVLGILVLIMIVSSFGGLTGKVVSEKKASEAVQSYFSDVGVDVDVNSVKRESGVYFMEVSTSSGQSGIITLSLDGKYLGELSLLPEEKENSNTNSNSNTQEIPKSEKPVVELFVMSFCPFGNKAEDTMLPVYELLKDNVEWNVHYIVSASGDKISSLHGQPETDQNIRELCVLNEYGQDLFWDFMVYVNGNCGRDGSCWKEGANKLGINVNKIETCFNNDGLSMMKSEAGISKDKGVSGSPTLIINGVKSSLVYQYGNSELYKQAICSSFENPPQECSVVLSGSTSTSNGGSC
jgi:hypothetical protein